MSKEKESNIDSFLFSKINDSAVGYSDHYLEQYRLYLHIFNSTIDRSQRANEFFLGINTAIMGVLGYVEGKNLLHESSILVLVPLVGVGMCICWYKIICSYKQLNRTKFKVIHKLEQKLPVALFETEWEILGQGKDQKKYTTFSSIEKHIPVIFTTLYLIFFAMNFPWAYLSNLFIK